MPIAILHEDPNLLAVDKPAGVVVIPARDEPAERSLRLQLERERSEKLWVVHRIDRDTSGVVLFARDAESHRALNAAFETRSVRKRYLAFTRGSPREREATVSLALHTARKGKMRPALPGESDALASETHYRVVRVAETAVGPIATIEVEPHTGRQHQIRVHLRAIEAPLLVDPLYGRCDAITVGELGPGSPALDRLSLHAVQLTVPHPAAGTPLTIQSPLADDLAALDAWLATRAQS